MTEASRLRMERYTRILGDHPLDYTMARIIYRSPTEGHEFLIDERAQKLMAYLYLYGPAKPPELVEKVGFEDESDLMATIRDVLSEEAVGFISVRQTGQLTLQSGRVKEVSITNEGKQFVERYQSEIAVPLSVQAFTRRMESIQEEIAAQLQSFEEEVFDGERGEDRERELEVIMEDIEGHFDNIRELTVDDS